MAKSPGKYDPLRDLDGDGDIDAGDNRIYDLDNDGRIDTEDREIYDLDNDNDIDASDRELKRQQAQDQEAESQKTESVGSALGFSKNSQGTWQKPDDLDQSVSGNKIK